MYAGLTVSLLHFLKSLMEPTATSFLWVAPRVKSTEKANKAHFISQ
jgi:hypothetical protein